MQPVIERDLAPVFVVRWPDSVTADDLRRHFVDVRAILQEGRAAFVIDLRSAGAASASLRRQAASELRQLFDEFGVRVGGVTHVVASPLVQGLMTAVYWLAPPPFPVHTTTRVEEAVTWARGRLGLAEARAQ